MPGYGAKTVLLNNSLQPIGVTTTVIAVIVINPGSLTWTQRNIFRAHQAPCHSPFPPQGGGAALQISLEPAAPLARGAQPGLQRQSWGPGCLGSPLPPRSPSLFLFPSKGQTLTRNNNYNHNSCYCVPARHCVKLCVYVCLCTHTFKYILGIEHISA